ncbi:MAG: transposase [Acidimicrobiales bacterium]
MVAIPSSPPTSREVVRTAIVPVTLSGSDYRRAHDSHHLQLASPLGRGGRLGACGVESKAQPRQVRHPNVPHLALTRTTCSPCSQYRDDCPRSLRNDQALTEFNLMEDHVHPLVEYPPTAQISILVNLPKGVSVRILCKEFPRHISRFLWKGQFWLPS